MSRANVAKGDACADPWQSFAFFKARWGLPQDLDPWLRRGVIVMLAAFILVRICMSVLFAIEDRERVITGAETNLDLLARAISAGIDLQTAEKPVRPPRNALASVLPLHALNRGQLILLSDSSGNIIARYPDDGSGGSMPDKLGLSSPLPLLAEKAGIMRVDLPGGENALATVRSLHEPLGQIAVIYPLSNVLAEWHQSLVWKIAILTCTAAVLMALAIAYFWQASRAQLANKLCHRVGSRIDSALSSGRCGLWDWDIASGHVYWSNSMYEIMGLPPGNGPLSFAEIDAMTHADDSGLAEIIERLCSSPADLLDHVFRLRGGNGEWVWLRTRAELIEEANGQRRHLTGVAVDVTEKMLLEERTATADLRLRDAIENISEAFVVWDADNRLVMCNSKFQRFHNLPADVLTTGSAYSRVMANSTTPVIQSQISLGDIQPQGARTFEAKFGDGRWLQINERRTKDGGYVSVGTDITALKRNEEQLIESERRLMNSVIDLEKSRQTLETQAAQLKDLAERYLEQKAEAESANRAKSDFLANMSHELRTPLNAILGFSEMMADEVLGPIGSPKYAGYSRDIHESGQKLLNVISEVLDMARLEAGRIRLERTEFAFNDVISAAMRSIAPLTGQNEIELNADIKEAMVVNADRAALEKVLTILLNNSVKYTPRNGCITIRAQAAMGALDVHVEDTGVGIPAEFLARLGRPFEQSDAMLSNGMRGSGLGLAIARSLIDLHGGILHIRSTPGQGTVIHVHIPACVEPQPALHFPGSQAGPAFMRAPVQLPGHLMAKKNVAKVKVSA